MYFMEYFAYYLENRPFIALTDHKPLLTMKDKGETNKLMQGWLDTINKFNFKVEYIPGEENVLADALSRMHDNIPEAKQECLVPTKTSTEAHEQLGTEQSSYAEKIDKVKGFRLTIPSLHSDKDEPSYDAREVGDTLAQVQANSYRRNVILPTICATTSEKTMSNNPNHDQMEAIIEGFNSSLFSSHSDKDDQRYNQHDDIYDHSKPNTNYEILAKLGKTTTDKDTSLLMEAEKRGKTIPPPHQQQ